MDPYSADRLIAEAQVSLKRGNHSDAEALLNRALETVPASRNALYMLGNLRFRTGRHSEAEAIYRQLTQRDPSDAEAHYGVGVALQKQGRTEEAIQSFTAALRARPDFTRAAERLQELRTQRSRPAPAPPTAAPGAPPPGPGPRHMHSSAPDLPEAAMAAASPLGSQLDDQHHAGSVTSGELLAAGHRSLRSFTGRILLSLLIAGVGFLVFLADLDAPAEAVAARFSSGPSVESAERRLQEATTIGAPPEIVGSLEADLAEAVSSDDEAASTVSGAFNAAAVLAVVVSMMVILHALAASRAERYEIYQHRIDIWRGVLSRRLESIWLYEISDVSFRQPLTLSLTGNAKLLIDTDTRERHRIVGFRDAGFLRRLFGELRDASLVERRAMRRWWV